MILTDSTGQHYEVDPEHARKVAGEWPTVGDTYYVVSSNGEICSFRWSDSKLDNHHRSQGIYRTESTAQAEAKRREARARQVWRPRSSDQYYFACTDGSIHSTKWLDECKDFAFYHMGAICRTEAEAEAWYQEFGKFFYDLEGKR